MPLIFNYGDFEIPFETNCSDDDILARALKSYDAIKQALSEGRYTTKSLKTIIHGGNIKHIEHVVEVDGIMLTRKIKAD